jgi:hypothetical protein
MNRWVVIGFRGSGRKQCNQGSAIQRQHRASTLVPDAAEATSGASCARRRRGDRCILASGACVARAELRERALASLHDTTEGVVTRRACHAQARLVVRVVSVRARFAQDRLVARVLPCRAALARSRALDISRVAPSATVHAFSRLGL